MAEKQKDGDAVKAATTKEDPPPEERVVVGFYFPYSVFPSVVLVGSSQICNIYFQVQSMNLSFYSPNFYFSLFRFYHYCCI